jgi:hypothetical protein
VLAQQAAEPVHEGLLADHRFQLLQRRGVIRIGVIRQGS